MSAKALAHPNIAFIKYWGNRNHPLRLPANGSISMNLDGLHSITSVRFDGALGADELVLGGDIQTGATLKRVSDFLELVREKSGVKHFARVESENNFPIGSGVASSSSAFAALALAASKAAGLDLGERELSALARRGSGSASRSVPGGYVEWFAADDDRESYAASIASPEHWDLVDCVAIVDDEHKATVSSDGHRLADSSPLQAARLAGVDERLKTVREAILARDFSRLIKTVELDSHLMHAVMMTSEPPLLYWHPATLRVLHGTAQWRAKGMELCATIDAGPNVHVISPAKDADTIFAKLSELEGVKEVLRATPGGPARLIA